MTGPLQTWIILLSFYAFDSYTGRIFFSLYCQNPHSLMIYRFTKIQSNIAIWQYNAIHSNTIHNMALTHIVSLLTWTMFTKMYTDIHVHTHVDVHIHTHAHTKLCRQSNFNKPGSPNCDKHVPIVHTLT